MRESGSGTRLRIERYFAGVAFVPMVRMELGSNEALKHAVAAGLGVTVMSRHVLDADPAHDGLAILDAEGFPLRDDFFVVNPRGKRLSVVAQAFRDQLVSESARVRLLPVGLPPVPTKVS